MDDHVLVVDSLEVAVDARRRSRARLDHWVGATDPPVEGPVDDPELVEFPVEALNGDALDGPGWVEAVVEFIWVPEVDPVGASFA